MDTGDRDIPRISPLPVEKAVIEIIDIMVLLLHRKYGNSSLQRCHLKVKINTMAEYTRNDYCWFCVKIKCSYLDSLELNLDDILQEFGITLIQIIDSMQKVSNKECIWIERTEKNGEKLLICHKLLDGHLCQQGLEEKKEHKSNRHNLKATSVCWNVVQSRDHIAVESNRICNYMHRIKLLAPLCDIQFYLNNWGVVSSAKFEWSGHTTKLGQKQIASDIQHYVSENEQALGISQIDPKWGTSFTLSCSGTACQSKTVRASVISAIIPQPAACKLGTWEINNSCNHLKLFFYGPGNLPLTLPASQISNCSLAHIVRLDDYGLNVSNTTGYVGLGEPSGNNATADLSYSIKPVDKNWQDLLNWEERQPETNYMIILVLVLDVQMPKENWHILEHLFHLNTSRKELLQLLINQRNKITKAVGNVLDKYLYNYKNLDEKQDRLIKVVSTVSSAIHDILTRSRNPSFQESCMKDLNVRCLSDAKSSLQSHLWSIVSECFDITPPKVLTNQVKVKRGKRKRLLRRSVIDPAKKEKNFDDLANVAMVFTEVTNTSNSPCERSRDIQDVPDNPTSPFSSVAIYEDAQNDEEPAPHSSHLMEPDHLGKTNKYQTA